MGLRDLARKGLGLLVEMPEEPASDPATSVGLGEEVSSLRKKSIGELLSELEGTGGAAPAGAVQFEGPPGAALQDGQLDPAAIYSQAGIAPIAFSAEQVLELIRSLPADLPLATKRQMVEASLNTMGRAMNVSKEQVLLDAHQKLQALAAYEDAARAQRDAAVAAMQQRVKEMQEAIDLERQKAADAEAQFQTVVKQCEQAGESLDEVQEFLTLDEGPSRMASGQ